MQYLPLFLQIRDRPVLLVGGGAVAYRKLRLLAEAGARITVVAPRLHADFAVASLAGRFQHIESTFAAQMLAGARLAIAATDDAAANRAVAAAADACGIWVNVVDDAALSTCIVPAIVDRSPLLVAISSAGTAPMLARWVRAKIELTLDESVGALADLCARWRGRIVAGVALNRRREFYSRLFAGPAVQLLRQRRATDADSAIAQALSEEAQATLSSKPPAACGRVTLVGAGPGDPGLLTVNALRALQEADVVLHDRLVSEPVLALARRDARLIDVGKQGGGESVSQEYTQTLMIELARSGLHVVRLKGGDPFIFGRGGEELEALTGAGIRYAVVPGISAAAAAAAYAAIPLTHRGCSQAVRFVSAHSREQGPPSDWAEWGCTRDTLAVYMGLASLADIRAQLVRHGRDPCTPVALIENVSRQTQRVALGILDNIAQMAVDHAFKSPSLLIVGDVTLMAKSLHWFGAPPLVAGLTRDATQSAA